MKCFISGTAGFGHSVITTLPDTVRDCIINLVTDGVDILIGDCQGVDFLVQQELKNLNYHRVTVYCSGKRVRNNIGNWIVKNIIVPNGVFGRDFYAVKDYAMCSDCDVGLAIWDGKSYGTGRNISTLEQYKKPVYVYRIDENTWTIPILCDDDVYKIENKEGR